MDDADCAEALERLHRRAAVDKALNAPQHGEGERPHEEDGVRLCLDCGEPIHPERLRAWPDAVRCVACKQRWEARR